MKSTSALGLALAISLSSCGGAPPAMIPHASAVSTYDVALFAEGNTLAIHVHQPMGMNMVLYEPILEGGLVAVTAGMVSSGSAHDHLYCFDVGALSPPPDWADHVSWREPGGGVVTTAAVGGDAGHEAIARCPSDD